MTHGQFHHVTQDEKEMCPVCHNQDRESRWEARSALRWGSRHEGYFGSEDEARAFAAKEIAEAGDVGRVTAVLGRVVYFDRHEDVC